MKNFLISLVIKYPCGCINENNMLEAKILGIFKGLEYDSFTATEISKLTNSKRNEVKLALSLLVKSEKIVEVKNKYMLNQDE